APFVVDLTYSAKITGRIQRKSLEGIWVLITRDIFAGDADALAAPAGAEATTDVAHFAKKLRRSLIPKLDGLLNAGDLDSKPLRRLAAQLGSE
ncbi:hypothetical protein, partial [Salmonella enterica]|uniref:hypothetical protein n=1 Tax=Salmonella enterica TaxID=28901 RepID=UPI0032B5F92A